MTPRSPTVAAPPPAAPPAPDTWGLDSLPPPRWPAGGGTTTTRPGDVPQLSAWAAGASSLGLRARVILLSGRGFGPSQVATALGVSRQTVHLWCERYARDGLAGLADRVRPSSRTIDDSAIVAATTTPPSHALDLTHWSARALGSHLGLGHSTVARAWKAHGIRPHGLGTFRLETTPPLVVHVADVAGLVVARDLRLVAAVTLPAGSTPGTRHHHAGPLAGRETGHGPLRAFAALRAARELPPGRQRPGADAVRTVLDSRLPVRLPDRPHELVLVGDRPDLASMPELATWRRAHPHSVVRHVDGPEQWLRLVEVLLRLSEVRAVAAGASGCAPELSAMLRGLVEGTVLSPGAFAWADPAWRRTGPRARRPAGQGQVS